MTAGAVGGMGGDLGRRQRKDQPAATRVDGRQPEHVVKQRADSVGVLAVDDRVGAGDHVLLDTRTGQGCPGLTPPSRARTRPRSSSPPSPHNFHHTPVVIDDVYDYERMDATGASGVALYEGAH